MGCACAFTATRRSHIDFRKLVARYPAALQREDRPGVGCPRCAGEEGARKIGASPRILPQALDSSK